MKKKQKETGYKIYNKKVDRGEIMYVAAVHVNDMEVTREHLSWIAGLLQVHENPVLGFWLLYAAVVIMSALVYHLGFAKKLKVWQQIVIYVLLLIGAFPLTIFAIGMAVVESLIAAALVLTIYRIRHRQRRKQGQAVSNG